MIAEGLSSQVEGVTMAVGGHAVFKKESLTPIPPQQILTTSIRGWEFVSCREKLTV